MSVLRKAAGAIVLLTMLAACVTPLPFGAPKSSRWTLSVLPPGQAAEQAARTDMDDAELLIAAFAFRNGFGDAYRRGLVREIKVFTTKAEFDRYLLAAGVWTQTAPVPENYVALFHKGTLLATAEDDARRTNPAMGGHDDYVRILTHEFAHGLHIAVLNGDDAAMGPRWFFEGFAVAAAGQFEGPEISAADYRAVIAGLPKSDYRVFGAAVRKLAQTHSYADLIERARKPGFDAWALGAVKF